ncbi:MAG: hypothetical protein ACRD0P_02705 [Stackebrandtia sp.]
MTSNNTTDGFAIAFLFHDNLELLSATLPRCLQALTAGSREHPDIILHCDGTPPDVAAQLPALADKWGVDELRLRRRSKQVASGDGSNNGHQRLMSTTARYLVVLEDDVVAYRTEVHFDPLSAIRDLFEAHPDVCAISTVADHANWSWKLRDLAPALAPGVRSTNRLSTHFIAYDLARFLPAARRFGAFEPDVFIDRDDHSYNWEDLVSHVATTGGRRIAFADGWPIDIFHCDRKVDDGSMYHTQDPVVKAQVLSELESTYRPDSVNAEVTP